MQLSCLGPFPDSSLKLDVAHHELQLIVQQKRGHKSEEYNKLNETQLYFAHDKW